MSLLTYSVNLKSLMKPKPLLMFLNARGRHLPWTFAGTEDDFCLLAQMPPCTDKEFCSCQHLNIPRSIQPGIYRAYIQRENAGSHYHGNTDSYELCAQRGLFVLSMQSKILNFLVQCANIILHDLHECGILSFPVQGEPPLSRLVETDSTGHARFSDILLSAHYFGPNSLNFTKLSGYISATFDTRKEHVWALREDPSYFSEIVAELEEHASPDNFKLSSGLSSKLLIRNLS
jgi:hypothetical protein